LPYSLSTVAEIQGWVDRPQTLFEVTRAGTTPQRQHIENHILHDRLERRRERVRHDIDKLRATLEEMFPLKAAPPNSSGFNIAGSRSLPSPQFGVLPSQLRGTPYEMMAPPTQYSANLHPSRPSFGTRLVEGLNPRCRSQPSTQHLSDPQPVPPIAQRLNPGYRPAQSSSHSNVADQEFIRLREETQRLMEENRRYQLQNEEQRARLHQERQQAEADQDIHNSWQAKQEAEIERLEKELEEEAEEYGEEVRSGLMVQDFGLCDDFTYYLRDIWRLKMAR
jgi:regulator of replication initiation timing